MEQVIIGGFDSSLNATTTEYNSLVGGYLWGTTQFNARKVVSTSGKIKNLRVKLVTGSPGAGKSYAFTLMLNGAPSALTLTISGGATSGADTTHEVDVVAGDTVSLKCNPDNTPTVRWATWTLMFEGATEKESLILGGTGGATLENVATTYVALMGARSSPAIGEARHREVCPTSGKIKNLYVELSVDPGTALDAYRFTLRKNGANQALTVTITADDKTGNDTVNEITVAAGDVLTLMVEPLNTPSAEPAANWGMTFLADTDGESVNLAISSHDLSADSTVYQFLQPPDTDLWGPENIHLNLGQSCTLKNLYVLLSAAPGDGNSYTFTVRVAEVDGNLTVTITDAATTGNDVVNTDAIANDDYVGIKCVPANTPDTAYASWSVVGYIAPAAPAAGGTSSLAQAALLLLG